LGYRKKLQTEFHWETFSGSFRKTTLVIAPTASRKDGVALLKVKHGLERGHLYIKTRVNPADFGGSSFALPGS